MAKRTYRSISSYLSFRYFSRVNREKWKEEYKDRTGRETARGWQFSPEFRKFQTSERNRITKFAERNPESFFDKKEYILKRSSPTDFREHEFSDRPTPGAELLNPMKGKQNWGVERLMKSSELRASRLDKKITEVIRINFPQLGISEVATSRKEAQEIRAKIMTEYGKEIARNEDGSKKGRGSYNLIGANYMVEHFETGSNMLSVIDVEMFLY